MVTNTKIINFFKHKNAVQFITAICQYILISYIIVISSSAVVEALMVCIKVGTHL